MEDLSQENELYNLWITISKARRCAFKAREREIAKYNITPEQAGILYIIHCLGGKTTRTELTRLTCLEFQTIYGKTNRMAKNGLIKLETEKDKRTVYVSITKKGEEIYNDSMRMESLARIFSFLSKEEKQELVATFKEVNRRALKELKQYHKEPFLQ